MEIRPRHWLVAFAAAALVHLAVVAGVRYEPLPPKPAPMIIQLGAGAPEGATKGGRAPIPTIEPAGATVAPVVAAPLVATSTVSKPVATKVVNPTPPKVTESKPKPKNKAITKPRTRPTKPNQSTTVASTRPQASAGSPAKNSGSIAGQRMESSGQGRVSGKSGGGSGPSGNRNRHAHASGADTQALANYHGTLVAWLNRHKRYPSRARRLRQEGTVRVSFTIDRNGRVLSHRIVTSSGHALLDQEIQAMLKRASPVPALPSSIHESRLTITVPIRFSLR